MRLYPTLYAGNAPGTCDYDSHSSSNLIGRLASCRFCALKPNFAGIETYFFVIVAQFLPSGGSLDSTLLAFYAHKLLISVGKDTIFHRLYSLIHLILYLCYSFLLNILYQKQ